MAVMETPCGACGRYVAGRTATQRRAKRGGKHRVRHRCPHGEWCIAGHPRANQGWNYPDCPECLAAKGFKRQVRSFGHYGQTGRA